jgi:DNA-binding transcriptional MerR regulator
MTRSGLTWRVRAFAARAGVTIKTLRHYDRLGVLRAARTPAGHRVYSSADLDRLRRIQALKQIGLRLAEMRPLLDTDRPSLLVHLTARRAALARGRDRLRRAERALLLVDETLRHDAATEAGLTRLADVIEMPRTIHQLQRYFTDEAWKRAKAFYVDWPRPEWIALCRDIEHAIPEGTDTARAAELVRRWNGLAQSLWRGFDCDLRLSRALHDGFARAWRDRAAWPTSLSRRFEDYRLDQVLAFVRDAAAMALHRRPASA